MKQITFLELLETLEVAENIYPFLDNKDLFSLSLTSRSINNNIAGNFYFWKYKILEVAHVDSKLISEFQYYCLKNQVKIDYSFLFKNIYKYKGYLRSHPLTNFKFLYPFAFKENFSKETTDLFQVTEKEIEQDKPFYRTLENLAYLLGNETLILHTTSHFIAADKENTVHKITLAALAARGGHIKLARETYPKISKQDILEDAILSGSMKIILDTIEKLKTFKYKGVYLSEKVSTIDLVIAAIQTDDAQILEFVLNKFQKNKKEKYKIRDKHCHNLLHLAAKENSVKIITFLINNYPDLLNELNVTGITPLFAAVKHCSLDTIKLFFKDEDKQHNAQLFDIDHSSLLWYAVLNQNQNIFDYLVKECGCNIRHVDYRGMNLVHQVILNAFEKTEPIKNHFFNDDEFNQLLNTLYKNKHIVERLIKLKKYSPKSIVYIVQYLESNGHLVGPSAEHISSSNLLRLFALNNNEKGVEYALTKLEQMPTQKLIDDLTNIIEQMDDENLKRTSMKRIKKILQDALLKHSKLEHKKTSSLATIIHILSDCHSKLKNVDEQSLIKYVKEAHPDINIPLKKFTKIVLQYFHIISKSSHAQLQANNNNQNSNNNDEPPSNQLATVIKK